MAKKAHSSEHRAQQLKPELGKYLKTIRENAELTQLQLAKVLDYDYYTFISNIENGKGRVPPERYEAWSKACKVPTAEFVKTILRFENPIAFKILFHK